MLRRATRVRAAALAASMLALAACTTPATAPGRQAASETPASRLKAMEALYPPWQGGTNNDATSKGLDFTVAPIDVLADFHGDPADPALVLYVGGNYFFAMAPLVAAFEQAFPRYRGRIYYETLPPGILDRQMRAGGTVTSGNMTWTARPDVYMAGLQKVRGLIGDGLLRGPPVAYVTNELTIMVPAGNPGRIAGLRDLGRLDLPLIMPNPQFEGVARQIRASLVKAGGEALANTVYGAKVRDGTTVLTRIHHRQTPLLLMQGLGEAGVTWASEAIFQEQAGHPISHVAIPAAENTTAIYAAAATAGAVHSRAAQDWLRFITSDEAFAVFQRYGFTRYEGVTAPRTTEDTR